MTPARAVEDRVRGVYGVVMGVYSKTVRLLALKQNEGLETLNELFEAGTLVPVIDRTFGLEETAQAFLFYETGQHKGKVVITVVQVEDNDSIKK